MSIDQKKKKKKKGRSSKIKKILNIINDECSTSEGENMMVIDGESGDELEDLTDVVGRSEGKSREKSKKKKKKKSKDEESKYIPEVAVGSDAGDAEEMSCYADDYGEFDDDGYEPSIGPTLKTGSRTSKSKRFLREVHVKMMMMSLMWMKKMVVLD